MLADRVSKPGPLTYESGALPIALRGPACSLHSKIFVIIQFSTQFRTGYTSEPAVTYMSASGCIS